MSPEEQALALLERFVAAIERLAKAADEGKFQPPVRQNIADIQVGKN